MKGGYLASCLWIAKHSENLASPGASKIKIKNWKENHQDDVQSCPQMSYSRELWMANIDLVYSRQIRVNPLCSVTSG